MIMTVIWVKARLVAIIFVKVIITLIYTLIHSQNDILLTFHHALFLDQLILFYINKLQYGCTYQKLNLNLFGYISLIKFCLQFNAL